MNKPARLDTIAVCLSADIMIFCTKADLMAVQKTANRELQVKKSVDDNK